MFSGNTPANETSFELFHDKTWLDGYGIGGIAYGIHVSTFCACIYFLVQSGRSRMTYFLLAFACALFAAGTVLYVSLTRLTELSFVTNRDYPGGPVVWYSDVGGYGTWTTVEDVAYFIAEILSDGLLLYRVWIIWNKSYVAILAPAALYITIIGLGLPLMCIPATWDNLLVVEAWFGCATALTLLQTMLIVWRLMAQARRMRQAMGGHHAVRYTWIAATIVESATPFAVCNILYIANYALHTPFGCVTWPLLSQVMCISPEMIILRVALGRAWSGSTAGADAGGSARSGLSSRSTAYSRGGQSTTSKPAVTWTSQSHSQSQGARGSIMLGSMPVPIPVAPFVGDDKSEISLAKLPEEQV